MSTVPMSSDRLSTVELAEWLLVIARDAFPAGRAAASESPGTTSLRGEIDRLDKALAGRDSEISTLQRVLTLRARLDLWVRTDGAKIASASSLRRQLTAWSVVARPGDRLIDDVSLLDAVIADDAMLVDRQLVNLSADVLKERVLDRRDDVLAHAWQAVAALGDARQGLIDHLRNDEPSNVASSSATSSSPPSDLGRSRADLELQVVETAAVATQALRSGFERECRAVLSEYARDLNGTVLRIASTAGLAQVIDDTLEIPTDASRQLVGLLNRMRGGSVGIAGPRGAGKSTLLRQFVDGRERIDDRPLLAVVVSAPVVYDSREFMLHLFAEICRAAGARPPAIEAVGERVDRPTPGRLLRRAANHLVWWLRLVGVWLVLGGLGAAALATDLSSDEPLVWGAVLVAAALVTGSLAWVDGHRDQRAALGLAVLAALLGVGLLVGGVLDRTPSEELVQACAAVVLGWVVVGLASAIRWGIADLEGPSAGPDGTPDPLFRPEGDELAEAASIRLARVQYQQSYAMGLSGKAALPVGVELGASVEHSLDRHPMTFPEVVDELRRFLGLAATERTVLLAIDELDKLDATDGTADRFLNDLKAAFGVPGTYFLVTVSEDAMSRFERRGLPFRDVFDSTFDEIVHVSPMTLAESQKLLAERVVGLPYAFSGLCHVLAGGVPRDLIRIARRIVDVNERLGSPDRLGAIVAQLVVEDLGRKVDAVQWAAIALDAPEAASSSLLTWVEEFRKAGRNTAALLAIAHELPRSMSACGDHPGGTGGLRRLVWELGSYGYFASTVLEFFTDALTEGQISRAAVGTTRDPGLELLARARTAFAVSPQTAWGGVTDFRSSVGLPVWPLPIR